VSTLRVALLQLAGCGLDLEASLAKGEDACRRAAAAGADLALFPECWSTGYLAFDAADRARRAAWLASALASDAPYVLRFAALARELGLAIGVTYLERTAGAPRNALALFDRTGARVLDYAKAHLCPWGPPDTECSPGNAFPVATLATRAAGGVAVGAMICFDREFPETARLLMLGGAELVLVPNACELGASAPVVGDLRLAQLRARAFENLVAIATANYAAPEQDGHSCVYLPNGAPAVLAGASEEIVLADLDLAALRAFRRAEAGRNAARRPSLYSPIAARAPQSGDGPR
jgi:N-carbamoylputrescine amidase